VVIRPIELPDRLAGAVWGHLVADAVGVPYEFRPASQIGEVRFGASGTHSQPPGTWSDDGALMLALLDSLTEAGFHVEDQGRRALAWADAGAYTPDGDGRFDIGGATSAALDRIRRGQPAATAGGTGERDLGNGSLMRILPIALTVGANIPDVELVRRAHAASAVTHGHPVAMTACALYVLVARGLLCGEDGRRSALESAFGRLREVHSTFDLPDRARLDASLDRIEGWTGRSGRGFVVDAFWSAWDAFAGARSYEETIVRAVGYGNDTDTTAAIAGGLAGIRWGVGGIPSAWLGAMRGQDVVDPLVDRLIESIGWSTSTGNPLRVAWIDVEENRDDPTIGQLGITFLPGKRDAAGRRRHWRTVRTDMEELKRQGASRMLLLIEDHELEALGDPGIERAYEEAGGKLVRYPIPDLSVPADPLDFRQKALWQLHQWMRLGFGAAIACRGGLGRSGLVTACMLVDWGFSADDAIAKVREARPGAIETREQELFVERYAADRGVGASRESLGQKAT
jgi:ADP-ribosylglycohydrolase/protein-tyrosine phosphatase